jgi:hypothetical protein
MADNDPTTRTVAALVHAECGHVAGVADDHETLREQAKALGVQDPQWEAADLDVDDAIERLLAGACHVCRIERTP